MLIKQLSSVIGLANAVHCLLYYLNMLYTFDTFGENSHNHTILGTI